MADRGGGIPQAQASVGRPTISTHVLDTATGRPAAGFAVTLFRIGDDGRPVRMSQALTGEDGRVADLLERPLIAGVYRLEFSPPARPADRDEPFFERAAVDIRVGDVSRSYHVPLLVSPFSLTTYRGS